MVVLVCLLPVKNEAHAVFPFRLMDTYCTHRQLESPDTEVGAPRHFSDDLTMDIAGYTGLGLPRLGDDEDN